MVAATMTGTRRVRQWMSRQPTASTKVVPAASPITTGSQPVSSDTFETISASVIVARITVVPASVTMHPIR